MKFDDLFLEAEKAQEEGDAKRSLGLWSDALDVLIDEAKTQERQNGDNPVPSKDERDLFPEYFEAIKKRLRDNDRAAAVSNNMGIIFFGEKDYDGSIRFFEQALDFCPSGSKSLRFAAERNLGMALFEEGRAREALVRFNTALALRPEEESAMRGADLCRKIIAAEEKKSNEK